MTGSRWIALCLVVAAAAAAQAAPADTPPQSKTSQRPAPRAGELQQAQAALETAIKEQVVRPVPTAAIAADARRIAGSLTPEQLRALAAGGEAGALVSAAPETRGRLRATAGKVLQNVTANAAGDPDTDLIFVPVAPCRIIDTRLAGGRINPGETRSFVVAGSTGFDAQGGNPSGCGIPEGASTPLAPSIVVNLVAVGPLGPGHMEAWAFGQPIPTASAINYAAVNGLNIANGVVVPIAGVATAASDLNVRANVSGTFLVADVTGYFTRFPTEQFQSNIKSDLQTNDFTTLVDMSDGACHELNSCEVTTTSAGTVVVEAWGQFVVAHSSGTLDRVAVGFETVSPVTCSYDSNSVDAADYEVSGALGSNPDVDFTVTAGKAFTQAAGLTRTYRLSGQMLSGANTGDKVENSRIICTFIPD